MFNIGDIVATPYGKGIVLYKGLVGLVIEYYILMVDFKALSLAKAPFRLENIYSDEPSFSYFKRLSHSKLLEKLIKEIRES